MFLNSGIEPAMHRLITAFSGAPKMKTLFALITIIILSTASLLAFGQSIYQRNDLSVADKIEQLQSGLEEIYRNKPAK